MPHWLDKFLQAFIPLFVAIDPIGLAAIFLGLGQNIAAERRQKIADQAIWTGGVVALGFLFLGTSIFAALGISVTSRSRADSSFSFSRPRISSTLPPNRKNCRTISASCRWGCH
jgi:hypothetical protein